MNMCVSVLKCMWVALCALLAVAWCLMPSHIFCIAHVRFPKRISRTVVIFCGECKQHSSVYVYTYTYTMQHTWRSSSNNTKLKRKILKMSVSMDWIGIWIWDEGAHTYAHTFNLNGFIGNRETWIKGIFFCFGFSRYLLPTLHTFRH